MGRIQTLPADLANQIAAGEVVERPASVVKELVENALDAGATRVKVELERGGATLIRVDRRRRGHGRGRRGPRARSATPRARSAHKDDLFALATFGFRGEALPSIASVSKLRLSTRARGAAEGVEVLLEGGGTARPRPTGAAEGTSVEVRDLFFNVPARRKFLKSTGTEAAHVSEALLLRGARAARRQLLPRARRARRARVASRGVASRARRAGVRCRRAARGLPRRARARCSSRPTSRPRSGRAPAPAGSTSSSTAVPSATARSRGPSRRRTARSSSRAATRSASCTSRSPPPTSTSTCTRRRPRCASRTRARSSTR